MVFGSKSSSSTKAKLFEQPLDKLFSPKAIKQFQTALLNHQENQSRVKLCNSTSAPLTTVGSASSWAKLSQENNPAKRKRAAARLRRFTIDANNNAHILSSITRLTDPCQQIPMNTIENETSKITSSISNESSQQPQNQLSDEERRQLLLGVLPDPIRRLLNELYLRGPSTVGIFRKSPNAKHCRELRQKLESCGQSSIEQFQVNVIASVFKEWLRSLPDCLLMSRLYPQWIDVAKLIEPLHLRQQQLEQQARFMPAQGMVSSSSSSSSSGEEAGDRLLGSPESSSSSSSSSTTPTKLANLRPIDDQPSPMTDKHEDGQWQQHMGRTDESKVQSSKHLVRARSCSIMTSDEQFGQQQSQQQQQQTHRQQHQVTSSSHLTNGDHHHHRKMDTQDNQTQQQLQLQQRQPICANQFDAGTKLPAGWSEFALRERHSECIRIVRQLLETLNEPNLILLRAIICVLWHIANQSEHNKMSSTNLGVCVGQSLLNDEHQLHSTSGSSGPLGSSSASSSSSTLHRLTSASNFTKRHRRARSQCLSTLSLTNLANLTSTSPMMSTSMGATSPSSNTSGTHLESNTAQETAKYVPMLIAFLIDNAAKLFGPDVISLFGSQPASGGCTLDMDESFQSTTNCDTTNTTATTTTTTTAEDDNHRQQMHASSLASSITDEKNCSNVDKHVQEETNQPTYNHEPSSNVSGADDTRVEIMSSKQSSSTPGDGGDEANVVAQSIFKRQQNVIGRISREHLAATKSARESFVKTHRRHLNTSVLVHIGDQSHSDHQRAAGTTPSLHEITVEPRDVVDGSHGGGTTSILIVNSAKSRHHKYAHSSGVSESSSFASSVSPSSPDHTDHDLERIQRDSAKTSDSIESHSMRLRANGGGGSVELEISEVTQQEQQQRQQQQQHLQRPLSATESTTSRASSSTSGLHSESPAFSSEPDQSNNSGPSSRAASQSTCSISSPAPSSSIASGCTSPIDMDTTTEDQHHHHHDQHLHRPMQHQADECLVTSSDSTASQGRRQQLQQRQRVLSEGHLDDSSDGERMQLDTEHSPLGPTPTKAGDDIVCDNRRVVASSTAQSRLKGDYARPRSMVSLSSRAEPVGSYCITQPLAVSHDRQLDYHRQHQHQNHLQQQQQQQQLQHQPSANARSQYSTQTLNRYSLGSLDQLKQGIATNNRSDYVMVPSNRMPKIPFQYTTSCYGGQAVLYYPQSYSHSNSNNNKRNTGSNHLHEAASQQAAASSYQSSAPYSGLECHRSQSLNHNHRIQQQPTRSHVMLLRDYYLSLQEQSNQKQQQQQQLHAPYRLERRSQHLTGQQQHQRPSLASNNANCHYQQQHLTSPPSGSQLQKQYQPCYQAASSLHHQPVVAYQRAQPRLAKIRPNQFSGGLYVKRLDELSTNAERKLNQHPTGPASINSTATSTATTAGQIVQQHLQHIHDSQLQQQGKHAAAVVVVGAHKEAASMSSSKGSQSSEQSDVGSESDDCVSSEGWLEESTMV